MRRLLRSFLFVPAADDRLFDSATAKASDVVILDLEDGTHPSRKDAARQALAARYPRLAAAGKASAVRVNGDLLTLATDLRAAVRPGLDLLVLPKVEHARDVIVIAAAVATLEAEQGLAPGHVRLLLQIESAAALPQLHAIAAAHPRVMGLMLGSEDFSLDCGGLPTEDLLLAPSLMVLHAARAAGVQPIGFVASIAGLGSVDDFRPVLLAGVQEQFGTRRLGQQGARGVDVAVAHEIRVGLGRVHLHGHGWRPRGRKARHRHAGVQQQRAASAWAGLRQLLRGQHAQREADRDQARRQPVGSAHAAFDQGVEADRLGVGHAGVQRVEASALVQVGCMHGVPRLAQRGGKGLHAGRQPQRVVEDQDVGHRGRLGCHGAGRCYEPPAAAGGVRRVTAIARAVAHDAPAPPRRTETWPCIPPSSRP